MKTVIKLMTIIMVIVCLGSAFIGVASRIQEAELFKKEQEETETSVSENDFASSENEKGPNEEEIEQSPFAEEDLEEDIEPDKSSENNSTSETETPRALPAAATTDFKRLIINGNQLTTVYNLNVTNYPQNSGSSCGPASAIEVRNYISTSAEIKPSSKKDTQMYHDKYALWEIVSYINKETSNGYNYANVNKDLFFNYLKSSLENYNPVVVLLNYSKNTEFKKYFNFKSDSCSHFSVITGLFKDKNGKYWCKFTDTWINRRSSTAFADNSTATVYVPLIDVYKMISGQDLKDNKCPDAKYTYYIAYSTKKRSTTKIYNETKKTCKNLIELTAGTDVYSDATLKTKKVTVPKGTTAIITEKGANGTDKVLKLANNYYIADKSYKSITPKITYKNEDKAWCWSGLKTEVVFNFSAVNCTKIKVEIYKDNKLVGSSVDFKFNYKYTDQTGEFFITTPNLHFKVDGLTGSISVKLTPVYEMKGVQVSGSTVPVKIR